MFNFLSRAIVLSLLIIQPLWAICGPRDNNPVVLANRRPPVSVNQYGNGRNALPVDQFPFVSNEQYQNMGLRAPLLSAQAARINAEEDRQLNLAIAASMLENHAPRPRHNNEIVAKASIAAVAPEEEKKQAVEPRDILDEMIRNFNPEQWFNLDVSEKPLIALYEIFTEIARSKQINWSANRGAFDQEFFNFFRERNFDAAPGINYQDAIIVKKQIQEMLYGSLTVGRNHHMLVYQRLDLIYDSAISEANKKYGNPPRESMRQNGFVAWFAWYIKELTGTSHLDLNTASNYKLAVDYLVQNSIIPEKFKLPLLVYQANGYL
ncbi:MAG: hypothetical protein NTX76_04595 [Alphaproteobacteria bacterium]|nr:hypothetical protein [Alphaproteobacteria bacterium]